MTKICARRTGSSVRARRVFCGSTKDRRGFAGGLGSTANSLGNVFSEEPPRCGGYLVKVSLEREVSGVEELDGGGRDVAAEGFSAGRDEIGIALAPDGEQRRLRSAEVLLKLRIELHVVRVVEKQIELDVDVAGARE